MSLVHTGCTTTKNLIDKDTFAALTLVPETLILSCILMTLWLRWTRKKLFTLKHICKILIDSTPEKRKFYQCKVHNSASEEQLLSVNIARIANAVQVTI